MVVFVVAAAWLVVDGAWERRRLLDVMLAADDDDDGMTIAADRRSIDRGLCVCVGDPGVQVDRAALEACDGVVWIDSIGFGLDGVAAESESI